MSVLLLIVKHNLKKKKGEVFILFILITLASLLLYTSISVLSNLNSVIDSAYDKMNTPDLFYLSNVDQDKIGNIIHTMEEVVEYEVTDSIYLMDVDYKKIMDEETKQAQIFFSSIEEDRRIGKLTEFEEIQVDYDSILLPYYMKVTDDYKIGDLCYFTLDGETYQFRVAGFVEDPLFSTPLNISSFSMYISGDFMEDLLEDNSNINNARYVQHKVRIQKDVSSIEFYDKFSTRLTKEVPEFTDSIYIGMDWESVRGGIGMMSRISMGILLVFSTFLILVSLMIIWVSIRNFIEMNLKNQGILQAAGFTTKQLVASVMMELGFIACIGGIIGVLGGIASSRIIGIFEGILIGLRWDEGVHVGAVLITMVTILAVILGVTYHSSRIYKKISVLEALRGGIVTHNFKKNHYPFDKTRLPVSIALAGKNLFYEKKKTVTIFCITMLLSLSTCVGLGLYENFAVSPNTLLKLIGSETGNIAIVGENLDEVGREIEGFDEVEKVLYNSHLSLVIKSTKGEISLPCDIWRDPSLLENEIVVEGRLPRYENEIVLGWNVANRLQVSVGDTVYVTGQGKSMDYLVCGVDQKITNMGLMTIMAEEGAKRLNGINIPITLIIFFKENISYDISMNMFHKFSDINTIDTMRMVAEIMKSVTMAMKAICILFVSITVVVVFLVEILLIKSKIIRERKNLGINKAFGFTSRQLIVQTMMMNLPVVGGGAVIGAALSIFLMEPLIVTSLAFCGIKKCPFTINITWLLVTVIGIILVAAITSLISAIRIRRIEPVMMLREE